MTYIPRWVNLDGVVNMRDLGGISTSTGQMVKVGVLLRSDNLADLSQADQEILLNEYQLTDVVDLRTNRERRLYGSGPLAENLSVRTISYSLYAEDDPENVMAPWASADEPLPMIDRNSHAQYLARHYLGYLFQRPDSILGALRTVANSKGAVIVHCAAGKDRTGVVSAILLRALGVEEEIAVADYAVSTDRIQQILLRLGAEATAGSSDHDLRADAQATPPEAMAALLNAIDVRHGGVPEWLSSQGWSEVDQRALEVRLLD